MKIKIRVIFWVHALVAAYCITCGVLDLFGHYHSSFIPSQIVFNLLMFSAVMFPLAATVSAAGSGHKHPWILLITHTGMGAAQLLFGLLPLIS